MDDEGRIFLFIAVAGLGPEATFLLLLLAHWFRAAVSSSFNLLMIERMLEKKKKKVKIADVSSFFLLSIQNKRKDHVHRAV